MNHPLRQKATRYIRNASALLQYGHTNLRRDALTILDQVLEAVDPLVACRNTVRVEGETLCVGSVRLPLVPRSRIWFFGAGKASLQIAKGVEEKLGERIHGGLVVCKEGQEGSLRRIRIRYASHPIPSEASVKAAQDMVAQAALPRAGDVVLCGITGGSSALLTLPPPEVPLEDLQALTKTLLTCGANIFEINAVRKHLSDVGGGRLAQEFDPGVHLLNLTVSDVIGDALDYITDPTVADTSTVADARATFERFSLWDRVAPSIRAFFGPGGKVAETPKRLPWPPGYNQILLSAVSPVEFARQAAVSLGYNCLILSTSFEGESQSLGETFAAIAREVARSGQPVRPPCALIGGGETIVKMNGFGGLGGPNQEFALASACQLPVQRAAVVLGLDTDGTDGPTEVAGGICDLESVARARQLGIDVRAALAQHDVTPALLQLGDAVITGATGTNVNDLKLLLVG